MMLQNEATDLGSNADAALAAAVADQRRPRLADRTSTAPGVMTDVGAASVPGPAIDQSAVNTMAAALLAPLDSRRRDHHRFPRLSGRPALYLLASLIVSLLASSSAPTPLYAVYQARWGFSPITTTIVFGIYAVSVLVALLTLGKLSDHVGRRPILLAALAAQAAAMLVFATADGVPALMIARVVQGVATGSALGAIGAGMLDIDPRRGTLANAVSPGFGTASGALLSALAVQFLPAPTHLIYLALLGVFALQALGITLMRETVTRTPGALASLKPEIKLPRTVRGPVLAAAPVLFAVWALAGLYGALGPALVSTLTGSSSVVLGGLSLFLLAAIASVAVIVLRGAQPRAVMLTGIVALAVGVVITLVSLSLPASSSSSSSSSSLPAVLFFTGTVISGIGFGSGFQGGIRTVIPLAAAHERSGVLSLLFVISYLGMGLPAVAAGFLTVHGQGLTGAAREYGAALLVLAALALVGLLRARTAKH
jgi:MFS family permease